MKSNSILPSHNCPIEHVENNVGSKDGKVEGTFLLGLDENILLGILVGFPVGSMEGLFDGNLVGNCVGDFVGDFDGFLVGFLDG